MNVKPKTSSSTKNSAKPETTIKTRWPKPVIVIVWIVGAYIASLFIPFVNAYTAYPLAVIKCGGKPIIASRFMGGYTYTTPENRYYSVSFMDEPWLYYCSAEDAERAGFRPAVLGR